MSRKNKSTHQQIDNYQRTHWQALLDGGRTGWRKLISSLGNLILPNSNDKWSNRSWTYRPRVEGLENRIVPALTLPLFDNPDTGDPDENQFISLDPDNDQLTVRVSPNVRFFDLDLQLTVDLQDPVATAKLNDLDLSSALRFSKESPRFTEFIIPNFTKEVFLKGAGFGSIQTEIRDVTVQLEGEPAPVTVSYQKLREESITIELFANGENPVVGEEARFHIEASNFGIDHSVTKLDVEAGRHIGTDQSFILRFENKANNTPIEFSFHSTGLRPSQFSVDVREVFSEAGSFNSLVSVFDAETGERENALFGNFTVDAAEFEGQARLFRGENGNLQIDRFDVAFIDSLNEPLRGDFQLHLGAVQGQVFNFVGDSRLVLEASVIVDHGNGMGPVEEVDRVEVLLHTFDSNAFRPIPQFSLSIDQLVSESLSKQFIGRQPHLRNQEISFVLLSKSGEELDRIRLSPAVLESLHVKTEPIADEFGQLGCAKQ